MLIGEFAKRVGVTIDAIRFYEKVGFFSSSRGENGYRRDGRHFVELIIGHPNTGPPYWEIA